LPLPRPSIPDSIRQQVELDAGNRCGYCLTERRYTAKLLHVEHIIPIATGGTSTIDNLWLACDLCNSYKGMATHATDPVSDELAPLFNPRKQKWSEHFRWSEDSIRVIGMTATGRATVFALRLNNPILVEARQWWVKSGWHPPT
jgi:hypothetical protein